MDEMSAHSRCVRSSDDQLRWHLMPSPCCSLSTVWVEIVMVREPKSSSGRVMLLLYHSLVGAYRFDRMQQGTYRFDRMQQVLTSAIIRVWSGLSAHFLVHRFGG
mgnify:CR=1 FL=1